MSRDVELRSHATAVRNHCSTAPVVAFFDMDRTLIQGYSAVALLIEWLRGGRQGGKAIAREVLAKDRAPERVNVYEIMSKPVVGVDPDMDIRYCARLFSKLGFSHAPVIDNGRLMGMVSYSQLVLKGLC